MKFSDFRRKNIVFNDFDPAIGANHLKENEICYVKTYLDDILFGVYNNNVKTFIDAEGKQIIGVIGYIKK
jgi:hypothetical protein